MESRGFDTLEATRSLESVGMESAHAGAVVQVVKAGAQGLATKSDLAVLEARMDAKLEALERRLTNRLYLGFGILFAALMAVRFFP